jgi:hypothetical protein
VPNELLLLHAIVGQGPVVWAALIYDLARDPVHKDTFANLEAVLQLDLSTFQGRVPDFAWHRNIRPEIGLLVVDAEAGLLHKGM